LVSVHQVGQFGQVPVTEIERLIEVLRRVHDGDAWHGPSVKDALEGVDAATARARPIGQAHSIWEIALHIDAWRREVTARLQGKPPSLPQVGDWPAVPAADEAWDGIGADLDSSHAALVAAVRQLSPDQLEARVGDDREPGLGVGVTVAVMLHGIVQHDAYHAGQIALLKRAT
jgi:uncharacterized damage-inducible protein DinB